LVVSVGQAQFIAVGEQHALPQRIEPARVGQAGDAGDDQDGEDLAWILIAAAEGCGKRANYNCSCKGKIVVYTCKPE
jgi:hypothetical protein